MSVVVATGLQPRIVRELTSYEIQAVWDITSRKG